jgi:hypothetical protein
MGGPGQSSLTVVNRTEHETQTRQWRRRIRKRTVRHPPVDGKRSKQRSPSTPALDTALQMCARHPTHPTTQQY